MKRFVTALASLTLGIAGVLSQNNMEEIKPIAQDEALVELKTTMGDIVVELYNDTPLHRDNFLKLVGEGFYDGVFIPSGDRFVYGADRRSGFKRMLRQGSDLAQADPTIL